MRIISIQLYFAGINVAYQGIYQALDGGGGIIGYFTFETAYYYPATGWNFFSYLSEMARWEYH